MKDDTMIGRRFGELTVLAEAERRDPRKRYWLCRCSCGNETIVKDTHLKSGHTKSCGCLRKKKGPEEDLSGKRFGRLLVLGQADGMDDSSRLWRCRCDCGNEIVCAEGNLRYGTTKSCGCFQEEQRKENMRNAIHFVDGTCVERIASRKNFSNNTSGHRGVYRQGKRWRALIGFQGKLHYLGSFERYEDAVEARVRAEEAMYDPFLGDYYAEKAR